MVDIQLQFLTWIRAYGSGHDYGLDEDKNFWDAEALSNKKILSHLMQHNEFLDISKEIGDPA